MFTTTKGHPHELHPRTLSERQPLHHWRTTTDLSLRAIGVKLGRNPSSLSRELARNRTGEAVYSPDFAQRQRAEQSQQSKTPFIGISERCIAEIKQRLQQYHSHEQISGRLRREGQAAISHETIYQMIYANHQGLQAYQQYLRQGRCKRRKWSGSTLKQGQIPGRVGLSIAPPLPRLAAITLESS